MLHASRPLADGMPGFIPVSEVRAYLDLIPVPATNTEVLVVLRVMDEAYLEEMRRKGRAAGKRSR